MNLDHALERIHQLEAILGMKSTFPSVFTLSEMKMLGVLLRKETVSVETLSDVLYGDRAEDDVPELKTVHVLICKLRKKLAVYGIKIKTWYNVGYVLDAVNKAKLKALCGEVSA